MTVPDCEFCVHENVVPPQTGFLCLFFSDGKRHFVCGGHYRSKLKESKQQGFID